MRIGKPVIAVCGRSKAFCVGQAKSGTAKQARLDYLRLPRPGKHPLAVIR
jgi:hypothetical protein